MINKRVTVHPVATLIKDSPGFQKKGLADFKLDALALCGFGCRYCSSNFGNYLRIRREVFADATQQQLGTRLYPNTTPELTLEFPDVVGQLERELAAKRKSFGQGKTLVFSMLTDGFSVNLVREGTTKTLLELLLNCTSFRIRVLTKNAIVGSDVWISFFNAWPGRFVVGLSTGSTNDQWAKLVELGTSIPSARLRALKNLQEAGVPTFGMLCPVFPDVLVNGQLERLIDAVNPAACEDLWAEPYNDRVNWKQVRSGYATDSAGHDWLTDVYENRNTNRWSEYALELYQRVRAKAERDGWLPKLQYLLYEHDVANDHVAGFGDLSGILLQSKPDGAGVSSHAGFANVQKAQAAR